MAQQIIKGDDLMLFNGKTGKSYAFATAHTLTITADTDESIRENAIKAIRDIRKDAQNRPELSLEEINAEINAVREAKANKI